jgi:hypothetical protein
MDLPAAWQVTYDSKSPFSRVGPLGLVTKVVLLEAPGLFQASNRLGNPVRMDLSIVIPGRLLRSPLSQMRAYIRKRFLSST